jgi:hypothetical protein
MTDAKTLLLSVLSAIPDGEKIAGLFAEDGVVDLPIPARDRYPVALPGSHPDQGVLRFRQETVSGFPLYGATLPGD